MAYDKPLKMQWIEVDGRTVPLVLPQYWSDEQDDWVVSSEQNRLPVDAQLTGSLVEQDTLKTSRFKNAETLTYQRTGALAGNKTEEVVFDFPNTHCTLQALSMGTDSGKDVFVKIIFYRKDGTEDGQLYLARKSGLSVSGVSAQGVEEESNGENDFWKVQVYDTTNNEYVLVMKRSLEALNGMKLSITNWSDTEQNVALNTAVAKKERV